MDTGARTGLAVLAQFALVVLLQMYRPKLLV